MTTSMEARALAIRAWGGAVDPEYVGVEPVLEGYLCSYGKPGDRGWPWVFVARDGSVSTFPSAFSKEQMLNEVLLAPPEAYVPPPEPSPERLQWLQDVERGLLPPQTAPPP